MGCVSSKDHQKVCQKCQAPCSRMYSSRSKPDSINLNEEEQKKKMNEVIMDFPMATAVIEAKNWSEMIEKKIPKILSKTTSQDMSSITPQPPTGEEEEAPETINTWELMEGLEEEEEEEEEETTGESSSPENDSSSASEMVYDSNSSTSVISASSELDKEEISSFRKELEELNPANPFHLNPLMLVCTEEEEEEETNRVRERERVVLYFTSLRGVRKTYKECCYVRVTLRELGFLVDERDVSMHSGFKGELKELLLLREEVGGFGFGLPRVFVGNKYIGGAEEIRHLHEEGELEKALEGCERLSSGSRRRICQGCGDIGFVPCQTCCGSCKIFYQHEHEHEDFYYQNEEEEDENEICDESEYGFQRCPDCNENGLIRCPICC